jgi:hypothetical protein
MLAQFSVCYDNTTACINDVCAVTNATTAMSTTATLPLVATRAPAAAPTSRRRRDVRTTYDYSAFDEMRVWQYEQKIDAIAAALDTPILAAVSLADDDNAMPNFARA